MAMRLITRLLSTLALVLVLGVPADAAMLSGDRSNEDGNLVFAFVVIQDHYQIANSVINGISLNTGGEGPVAGWLTQFIVLFTDEFVLDPDHYFIVPQIEVLNGLGEFLWASAPRNPPPFTGDLQTWIRNSDLDPDWLRVGTDIVGGTTFNASFSLSGVSIEVLVHCSVPVSGGIWKMHGQYDSMFAHEVVEFLEDVLIIKDQAQAIVASAA